MKKWYAEVEGQSLLLKGRDVVDLLQRVSTNDVAGLLSGQTISTILTSEKGRIVGVMSLRPTRTENTFSAAVWGRNNTGVAHWIEKYVIMEDVQAVDESENMTHILCFEDAGQSNNIRPIPDLPVIEGAWNHDEQLGDNAWNRLVVPRSKAVEVREILHGGQIENVTPEVFEFTRISAGIPLPGRELDESTNPLEAGLRQYVSFKKGCYVGQEVIARLDSYRKVAHILSRIGGNGDAPPNGQIEDASGELGYLTSAIAASTNGWVGLAYLRERAFAQDCQPSLDGRPITILDSSGFNRAYEVANV